MVVCIKASKGNRIHICLFLLFMTRFCNILNLLPTDCLFLFLLYGHRGDSPLFKLHFSSICSSCYGTAAAPSPFQDETLSFKEYTQEGRKVAVSIDSLP